MFIEHSSVVKVHCMIDSLEQLVEECHTNIVFQTSRMKISLSSPPLIHGRVMTRRALVSSYIGILLSFSLFAPLVLQAASLQVVSTSSMESAAIPSSIHLSDFPAASVQDVVVPVPSEIFLVLDKLGNPNWKAQLQLQKIQTPDDRVQVALLLGSVISEGFIAVEAEDTERVKELGRDVLTLADAINVRKSVLIRSKSIIEKADHHDWHGIRVEFDGALQDVRAAMDEMNDEDLAQLVSLGGWLRGTHVLTSIVDEHYSVAGAELLHQPELLHYFDRCVSKMSPRLRKNPLVARIHDVLNQMTPIIDTKKPEISHEKVKKIHLLTEDLLQKITTVS